MMYMRVWIALTLCFLFSALVLAGTVNLQPNYRVSLDENEPGNCKQHLDFLVTTYREAYDAAKAAVQAIENLKTPRPSCIRRAKKKQWNRQAQMFTAMFGFSPDTKIGGFGENAERADSITGFPATVHSPAPCTDYSDEIEIFEREYLHQYCRYG